MSRSKQERINTVLEETDSLLKSMTGETGENVFGVDTVLSLSELETLWDKLREAERIEQEVS